MNINRFDSSDDSNDNNTDRSNCNANNNKNNNSSSSDSAGNSNSDVHVLKKIRYFNTEVVMDDRYHFWCINLPF